jgi:hypothetical protein
LDGKEAELLLLLDCNSPGRTFTTRHFTDEVYRMLLLQFEKGRVHELRYNFNFARAEILKMLEK